MSLLLDDPTLPDFVRPPIPADPSPDDRDAADEAAGDGGSTPPPRRPSRRQRLAGSAHRHPIRTAILAVLAVVALVASVSWVQKLREPGDDTVVARSAEWLRDIHLGALVNLGEQIAYALHPPAEGGAPERAIAMPPEQPADTRAPGIAHLPAPAPLTSPASPALPGEGQWQPVGPVFGDVAAVYTTQIRPDAVHTSYLELVAWMDPKVVRFQLHPGAEVPGGQWSTPSSVAAADQAALVAAFNGGFRMQDAKGGFYADGKGASTMVDGHATLAIDDQGVATVGQWGRDLRLGPHLVAARQNLALIVDGGQPVADLDENPGAKWGATVGNKVFVWRSGVGVTADGALVYVAGPSLSAKSLAETLARAGAVRAMELDINHDWVTFNSYRTDGGTTSGTKLLPEMFRTGNRYLTTDSRDFVAVLLRDPSGGAGAGPASTPPSTAAVPTTTAAPPTTARRGSGSSSTAGGKAKTTTTTTARSGSSSTASGKAKTTGR